MLVHVINLDRSADRLAEFMAANGHLKELSRFPAIDGSALDVPELVRAGTIREEILVQDPAVPKDLHAKYTRGALGPALSHIALWGKAIAGARPLTICEDDVVFHSQYGAMEIQRHVESKVQERISEDAAVVWREGDCTD